MSISINISGTVIDFPESGSSPSWAPALISFAQAVEAALSGVVGPYDVPPQIFNIDVYNPGVEIPLPNFSFPVANVRGVDITYTVFRNTTTTTAVEKGTIEAVYNPNGPIGNKWNTARTIVGDAFVSLNISDNGQVTLTTEPIVSGSGHQGRISYSARAILQDGS